MLLVLCSVALLLHTPQATAAGEDSTGDSSLEQWVDVAQIVTAGAAVFGFIFVWLQLRGARRTARDARTAEYLRRFQEPEFNSASSRAFGFLDTADPAQQEHRIRAWEKRAHAADDCLPTGKTVRASPNDVWWTVAFFDELGEAFNTGLVNRRAVARMFQEVCPQYYEPMKWFGPVLEAEYLEPEGRLSWRDRPFFYRRRKKVGTLEGWGLMNRRIRKWAFPTSPDS